MDTNETEVEKSIGRRTVTGAVSEPPRDTCTKSWCEARVSPWIIKEDGVSVEIKRCTKGHFVRRRQLDHDGSTYRVFKAISIPGP